MVKQFGLNAKTGIDLSGEGAGFVPTKTWRESRGGHWYIGDTYNLSIGQGDLLVTPLQVNSYTAAIANKGTWSQPHLVQGPSKVHQSIKADSKHFETVRAGMRDGVTEGSSRALADLPVPAAGKTGTAQSSQEKNTFGFWLKYDHPETS